MVALLHNQRLDGFTSVLVRRGLNCRHYPSTGGTSVLMQCGEVVGVVHVLLSRGGVKATFVQGGVLWLSRGVRVSHV